jgi:hypothetical protein
MVYFLAIIFAYFLLTWGAADFLVHGSEERQLAQIQRRGPVVRVGYWLLTAPLIFVGVVYVLLSRWSLSTALLPVAVVMLLLSGIAAGMYQRVARVRWPLLIHAGLLCLASPYLLNKLWEGFDASRTLYRQYPFLIEASYHEYVDASWAMDADPTSYSVTKLYKTILGFDYYVGDVNLGKRPAPTATFQQEAVVIPDTFWQSVQSLHLAPDSSQGQLRVSPLLAAHEDSTLTGKLNPPKEEVVNFWLDTSPEPQKRPE